MESLRKFFGRKPKERDELGELGLNIYNDGKLAERIEEYRDFHEFIKKSTEVPEDLKPDEKVDLIAEHVHTINEKMHKLAIPWGRAGDRKAYALMMSGWSTIYSRMLDIIASVVSLHSRGDRPDYQKEELVKKLRFIYETFFVKYALLITEVSWLEKDVSPAYVTVVHQPAAPYVSGLPLGTSGGRVSDIRRDRTYPEMVSSDVGEEEEEK